MKNCITCVLLFFGLAAMANTANVSWNNTDFTKHVFKVKATIKKVGNDFVIVPEENKSQQMTPTYLPDEYKINGLKVTFDGDVSSADATLNLRKIWVEYELKEKYRLAHKMYELN